MDFKQKALKLAVGMIYYSLDYVKTLAAVFDNKDSVVLSEAVLPDKSKEPNYDIIEDKRDGVVIAKRMIIKDHKYETKRDAVRIYSAFLGIELEKAGEALDYFLEFFRSYTLSELQKNKFAKPVSKDSNCVYFGKYKETWLKWLNDFADRIILDPEAMGRDIKELRSHTHLTSTWMIENNTDKIKDFLPEVLNG